MNAEAMRLNAENCLVLAEFANDEPSRRRYIRMADAWKHLAESDDWLSGCLQRGQRTLRPFSQEAPKLADLRTGHPKEAS